MKVTPLDGAARIQWNADGRKVMVTRSTSETRSLSAVGDKRVVYTGTGSRYVDRGLTNGVEYRYVVMAVDAAGNHSAGVAAVIVPRRNLLKSPKDGARLKKAPKLVWAVDSEAQYYNAQLLLNGKRSSASGRPAPPTSSRRAGSSRAGNTRSSPACTPGSCGPATAPARPWTTAT